MKWGIVGFLVGIVLGIYAPLAIPIEYSRYTAVAILAILDSILGAVRADLQIQYNSAIFISGLLTNMILAALITFIGDRLGLDLYLAIVIAFTIRILQNIAIIRYVFIEKWLGRKKTQEMIMEKEE